VPSPNHVDGRRRGRPREYLDPPHRFGRAGEARLRIPAGGDRVSAGLAWFQHRLAAAWAARGRSGAAVGREYGVSRQVVSRTLRGERWLCATLTAALVLALERPPEAS